MKTISVHIVTFNSEKDIHNCLEAVCKQTYPVEQIVVVDNDSMDGTRELLEQYRGRIHLVLKERLPVNSSFKFTKIKGGQ